MKLKLARAVRIKTGSPRIVSFEIPADRADEYAELVRRSPDRLDIELATPGRPRSTGPDSQNHRINGFIQQICVARGLEFDALKYYCKYKAIERGYPFDTVGEFVVPWSEARIDTAQAGMLIDTIEQVAAEQGVHLVEK